MHKARAHEGEGLNLFYRLIGEALLLYMQRFKSTRMTELLNAIKETLRVFEWRLSQLSKCTSCLGVSMLERHRLIKKKHYVYGAYLATISSYPVLYWSKATDKILASIFAKTSAITSIKVFDNLNDRWHSKGRAAVSLSKYLEAFTEGDFSFNEEEGFIPKAENSAYSMARWTFDTIKRHVDAASPMFKLYVDDFTRLIKGQVDSLTQKMDNDGKCELDIRRYLKEINEKSVGCTWLDIDFCFYERALGGLNDEEEAVNHARAAMDHIFKACNLYDDVADLSEDSRNGITNSVGLLAVDQGYCSMEELLTSEEPVKKLKRSQAVKDTVLLADLILLKGLDHLHKAKIASDHIDVDAMIFGTRILRAFSIRKWVLRDRDTLSLGTALRSFQKFESYHIPERIVQYAEFI